MTATTTVPRVAVKGADIPAVGLGTWQLRGDLCARMVSEALRSGYRHVDTAQGYQNETKVGEGIRAAGVPRADVFLTTKVRPELLSDGALQRSVEESLRRLGVDVVDLVLVHWPNPEIPLAETIRALGEVRRSGLARNIGLSNFTAALLEEALGLSTEPIVTNQIEYHPLLNQERLLGVHRRLGLATTAYCPMALGRVVGTPAIEEIGRRHDRTATQVALRWLTQQGDVIAIPKTSKSDRLQENLDVFSFNLSDDEMAEIAALGGSEHLVNEPAWVPKWD